MTETQRLSELKAELAEQEARIRRLEERVSRAEGRAKAYTTAMGFFVATLAILVRLFLPAG